mmetsp:Transcript_32981/g.79786  ORF Transcript_32981/g.79786 Transcript_32981/m.79786 type:complete len:201 (-) Transcript_32981:176-778(-)|eukprot:CAMPEP_0181101892 /NCGR_PEP_ID=MMETSP1071-20121207/14010_1 /TAXON_ID=35127 /ORGANISM="Thalassiosira sp., Strain NH16" /LENGTH=200 /DNA_ID=CAMNT_0023184801 /DNA_START=142 /DNA_END=744 /DNA_ORIENTATION=-
MPNNNSKVATSFSWRSPAAALLSLFAIATIQAADAFSTVAVVSPSAMSAPSTIHGPVAVVDVGGRHFQLEELEESEASITCVQLNADHSVTLGRTDGPPCHAFSGNWLYEEQLDTSNGGCYFQMTIERRFVADNAGSDFTHIGEFEYSVERTYCGEISLVGGSLLSMNGQILDVDEIFGERRVGFFNMIDTTVERITLGL